jgi:membrane protein implicated in regulation of membrane protease activity
MELIQRLKGTGIGLGLFVIALNLIITALLLLVFAGVFALSLVLPLWVAALISAGGLVVIAVIVAVFGAIAVKTGGKPVPTRSLQSVRDDIATIRGDRDRGVEDR